MSRLLRTDRGEKKLTSNIRDTQGLVLVRIEIGLFLSSGTARDPVSGGLAQYSSIATAS